MSSFVVFQPATGSPAIRDDAPLFVRDGFSWLAFAFPVPWLLVHRLWFHALAVFLVSAGIGLAAGLPQVGAGTILLMLLTNLLVGLEGSAWRLAEARRRGWQPVGIVEAKRVGDAEIRWFLRQQDEPATQVATTPPPLPMPRATGRADLVFGRT